MLNIHKQPQKTYAFFDVDETIISMKSMFSFIDLYFSHYPDTNLEHSFRQTMEKERITREVKNANYYHFFRFFPITNVKTVCRLWFEKYAGNTSTFYHPKVIQQLKQHQAEGTECVFVSGSFKELLQPIADDLGVAYILSIHLERDGLMFTGNIIPPQTIGTGKAEAIKTFLMMQQSNPNACFAYGDDISDVPMLALVGHPRAVSGEAGLEQHARNLGWNIITPY